MKLAVRPIVVLSTALLASACGLIVGLKDRELYDGGVDSGSDGALVDSQADANAGCAPDTRFQTDDKNCGRCGHDCLGGLCTAGICQPITIGATTAKVYTVAVDGTNVYWEMSDGTATGGTIQACPITGCGTGGPTTIIMSRPPPLSLAVYGANLYWSEVGTAGPESISVSGGSFAPIDDAGAPNQVLVAGSMLYWTNNNYNTAVRRCTPPSCTPTNVTPPIANGTTNIFVEQSTQTLYFSNANSYSLFTCGLGVNCGTAPKDMKPTCYDGGCVTASLVADSTHLYFGDNGVTIWACGAGACGTGATILDGAESLPRDLLIDGTNLYWTNVDAAVRWCVLPDCTTRTDLAVVLAHGLAQDTKALYFGNGASIMKVAKP